MLLYFEREYFLVTMQFLKLLKKKSCCDKTNYTSLAPQILIMNGLYVICKNSVKIQLYTLNHKDDQ